MLLHAGIKMDAAKISRFQVVKKIGTGPLCEVYEAADTELGISVAFKTLPRALTKRLAIADAFIEKAHALQGITHPNVCSLLATGKHDGQVFVAMELLHGRTLRNYLETGLVNLPLQSTHSQPAVEPTPPAVEPTTPPATRGSRVRPPYEIDGNVARLRYELDDNAARLRAKQQVFEPLLDLAIQVARALEFAHERGMIHLGLSPENIFITDEGIAKILNLGLAGVEWAANQPSALTPSDDENQAATGEDLTATTFATIPNLHYLSPEHVRRVELDPRADIYSFGALLYEMFTGKLAFPGDSEAQVFESILERFPAAPSRLRPDLPQQLNSIILQALDRDRGMRHPDIGQVRWALEGVKASLEPRTRKRSSTSSSSPSPSPPPSLRDLVLPAFDQFDVPPEYRPVQKVLAAVLLVLVAALVLTIIWILGSGNTR